MNSPSRLSQGHCEREKYQVAPGINDYIQLRRRNCHLQLVWVFYCSRAVAPLATDIATDHATAGI